MKILFIGGTGLISSECALLAAAKGHDVYLLNRGNRPALPGTQSIIGDITKPDDVRRAIANHHFDCVANFIAYGPEDVQRDIDLFTGRTDQYILISTCATYQKPPTSHLMTEGTPQANPFWPYAQLKIQCEHVALTAYREKQFPLTIVRPSLTYGDSRIPAAYHNSIHSWTTAWRMLNNKPVIVHGDGTSLWQITHAADFAKGFVGLAGNPLTLGHAFHITTDEVLCWDQILIALANALGVKPNLIHIPADLIAKFDPVKAQGLHGDKIHSLVYDNTKLKSFVPGFQATIPFHEGIKRTVAWFKADGGRQTIDDAFNATADKIIAAYQRAFA